MRRRPYVLFSWFAPARRIVMSADRPDRCTEPHYSCMGPFRTYRAAQYVATWGCALASTVAAAERLAKPSSED